jgi:hypothetical protein
MSSRLSIAANFFRFATSNSRSQCYDANAVASACLCLGKLEDDIFQPPNAGLKLPYDMNDEHLKANLGSTQIDTPARSARAHSGYFDDGATMQKSTLSLTQLPLIGSPICAMSIR